MHSLHNQHDKNRTYLWGILSMILIVFVAVLFGIVHLMFFQKQSINNSKYAYATMQKKYQQQVKGSTTRISTNISVTPTISMTPILTQIPTQPPPSGFCLNVPVLFYHHIQPESVAKAHGNTSLTVDNDIFDTQMQYLTTQGYTTITAQQLVNALKNHTSLAPKSMVITLDDGYQDNYTYAFPIVQKYHLIANIMLATGLMEGADYLTWAQIKEMQKSGSIYYTDHTWSHYAVNHGTNEKIQYEILTAKQQIETNTGQTMNVFTYPYGSFNNNAITLLQQDGFIGAFSTLPGKLQCDSYIMALHRTRIGNAPLSTYGL